MFLQRPVECRFCEPLLVCHRQSLHRYLPYIEGRHVNRHPSGTLLSQHNAFKPHRTRSILDKQRRMGSRLVNALHLNSHAADRPRLLAVPRGGHRLSLGVQQAVHRAFDALRSQHRHMGVQTRCLQSDVAEEFLDETNVRAVFQQVSRERMALMPSSA